MINGLTYTDAKMTTSAEKCWHSMLKSGVDNAIIYRDNYIDPMFKELNRDILKAERGCGYWLWKPYMIMKRMMDSKDGDIVVYADAGVEFISPVRNIIDVMDEDIFFFTNGFPQVEWCKGECIKVINGIRIPTDGQHLHLLGYHQVQASAIFFKVNQKTKDFVKEWLLYSQMPGFIDDSPSKTPNYPTFAEHRHDQAILTCLQIKHGYKLHWWPTTYSEHIRVAGDNYPVMFNHHRKRNDEWQKVA